MSVRSQAIRTLVVMVVGVLASVADAAWISEMNLAPQPLWTGSTTVTLPRFIEVTGVTEGQKLEILTIDARDRVSAYGVILHKVQFTVTAAAADMGVAVVVDSEWPAVLHPGTVSPFVVLPSDKPLNVGNLDSDSRSFILLNGWTQFTTRQVFKTTSLFMVGATVADAVTIGPPVARTGVTRAKPVLDEPVLDPRLGSWFTHPNRRDLHPSAPEYEILADPYYPEAASFGYVTIAGSLYPLTPGFMNPAHPALHAPEPASAMGLVVLLAATGVRRRGVRA